MQDDLSGSAASITQFDEPIVRGLSGTDFTNTALPKAPEAVPSTPPGEPSNLSLLGRSPPGGQDAATKLYRRYVKRLRALVENQCSAELANCAGVEDLVQSAFASFFRRIDRSSYNAPDGDELWKLLLVIALHKIRGKATYHHAAKRDSHRTISGVKARIQMESRVNVRDASYAYVELVLEEILDRLPPQNRVMVKLRLDGCGVAEVARLTGRSRRSVERILQESRLKLGAYVQQDE
jgi:RNA polymerase sigma-70 factor, ECF subfamily